MTTEGKMRKRKKGKEAERKEEGKEEKRNIERKREGLGEQH